MHAWMPSLRSVSVMASVALAATALSAQDRGNQRPGGPQRVIVRAWANGQAITDLKPADLSIKVDGKQREVKALDLVTVAAAAPAPAAAAAPAAPAKPALPAPYATNAAAPAAAAPSGGREFLLLIDEEGIAAGQEETVRTAMARLMAEMYPSDRVGIFSTRLGGVSIAPTSDRQPVLAALGKFVGGGSTTEKPLDATCRAQRAIGTLSSIFRASPAGRTLVLVSPGIAANIDNNARMMSNNVNSNDVAQTCMVRSNDMDELGAASHGSPANLYVLHYPEGMANQSMVTSAQAGLENIAGVTGAEFMRLTSGGDASLSRLNRETSAYYIATLDEGASGPMRRIDARVTRDGARVVARPAGGRPAGAGAPASAKNMQARDMATTTASFTEVPLRAIGIVSRQGASDMKVVAMFEPADPGVKLASAAVALVDDKGKGPLLTLKPEDLQRSPVVAPMLIKPGKYRLRIAAKTADGLGGTVDVEVEGALQDAPPLKMSGLMLGISGPGGFVPKLQFSTADTMAVGVLEVYGVAKGATLTAELEMLEADGSQRGVAPGMVQNGPADDVRMVFGGFDIGTLEPGDYTMRVKVSVDGKPAGTATRTVRKVGG